MANEVTTVAGSSLAISSGLPATEDQAGYEALSFTTIGEVTNIGTIGRVYNQTTHQPLAERRMIKLRGSYDNGTLDVQMAYVDDAGQTLVQANIDDTTDPNYSFKLTDKRGSVKYFQGLVISNAPTYGAADDVITAATSIGVNSDIVDVAAP